MENDRFYNVEDCYNDLSEFIVSLHENYATETIEAAMEQIMNEGAA